MLNKLLLLTALVGCADLDTESEEGSLAATASNPGPVDPCSLTDQPVYMPRIRAVKWSWEGCGPTTADSATVPAPLRLNVYVDVTPETEKIEGTASGCDSFVGKMAQVTCYPTVPPSGRKLALTAATMCGGTHQVSVPITDCVDGSEAFPDTK
jgi:hypothetical protein